MDLTFTPEQEAFRAEARAWLTAHVPPHPLPSLDTAEGFEAHRAWERTLFDDRWSVVSWPVEYGGRDVGIFEWLVFEEEYYRARAPKRVSQNGIFLLAPTMLEYGTEAQKARYLPPMAAGDEIWCQGWSEPDAGSDLAGIRSRAARDTAHDGNWILNGQKTWASRGAFADWCFGIFRTDPEAERHRGLTYFLVAMDSPGVTVRPIPQIDGETGFAEIFFDNVEVPEDQVLGEVGAGWNVAMATAGSERGLSLRSPARYTEAADRLVQLYALARRPDRGRRRRGAGPHGRRGLQVAHLLDGLARSPAGTPSGPRPAATRSSGPRPTWPSTPPRSTCSAPTPRCWRPARPANGSTATSSRSPGRFTPGPTRSSATWWPSACSGCPGADRWTSPSPRNRTRCARACAWSSTPSAPPTRCAPSNWPTRTARVEQSQNRWAVLAELGAPALVVPESADGLGLSDVDLVGVLEEAGRAGLPEPLLETAALAAPTLAALLPDAAAAAALAALVRDDVSFAVGGIDVTPDGIVSPTEVSADGTCARPASSAPAMRTCCCWRCATPTRAGSSTPCRPPPAPRSARPR